MECGGSDCVLAVKLAVGEFVLQGFLFGLQIGNLLRQLLQFALLFVAKFLFGWLRRFF